MSSEPTITDRMTSPSAHANTAGDRLATQDVSRILWNGRIPLVAITLGITLATTAAAFLIPAKYEANVVMMPVPESESEDKIGGLGSAASQIGGGLASLAGLSATGNTLKTEAMAILDSEALTVRYIRENNLLPVLYKSRWDPVRMQWKPGATVPTLWKANRNFRGVRTLTDNLKTGLITLTISWRDPNQAAKWANDLVAMTNEYLRTKAVDEAERNITFLEEEERRSTVVTLQQASAALKETQLRKMMLARSRTEYALRVLDPATVPEKQAFPVPAIWIPAGFFGGLFLAVLFVLLRASGSSTALSSQATSSGAKRSS
jgi:uncharacterized protein involved in exopolysaccharide biosynthesis